MVQLRSSPTPTLSLSGLPPLSLPLGPLRSSGPGLCSWKNPPLPRVNRTDSLCVQLLGITTLQHIFEKMSCRVLRPECWRAHLNSFMVGARCTYQRPCEGCAAVCDPVWSWSSNDQYHSQVMDSNSATRLSWAHVQLLAEKTGK